MPCLRLTFFFLNTRSHYIAQTGLKLTSSSEPPSKNEMLSFAGKWMELENIILSEVSLAQKTKNRMFSLICGH
jgi:hypothetical protein